ncbi:MAG: hypothetical protein EBS91_09475 [Betaproteobacteria bacterium]|nr:hypothetical protein [Betaproteobacteria bacterium]NCA24811.1 hypothetical protein [Betaproteobacteria bacterium]
MYILLWGQELMLLIYIYSVIQKALHNKLQELCICGDRLYIPRRLFKLLVDYQILEVGEEAVVLGIQDTAATADLVCAL